MKDKCADISGTSPRRKKRRRKTIQEIFSTDHYRSIILLTKFFDRGDGLHQLHYRYALIKDHDNIYYQDHREQLDKIFGENRSLYQRMGYPGGKLDQYYADKLIIKDSVSSNNSLFNFLQKLVEDYKILRIVEDEKGNPRYKLTQKGQDEAIRWHAHQIVNWTRPGDLEDLVKVMTKFWDEKEKKRLKKQEQELIRGTKKGKV